MSSVHGDEIVVDGKGAYCNAVAPVHSKTRFTLELTAFGTALNPGRVDARPHTARWRTCFDLTFAAILLPNRRPVSAHAACDSTGANIRPAVMAEAYQPQPESGMR